MEAYGQQAADFFGGAGNLGHDAAGRKRDAAAREADALAIHDHLHRIADIFKVVKRLAHTHQHHIADQTGLVLWCARHRPFAQIIACDHHLTHDLGGSQVADQLLRAGMAEGTGQRAAHLAGDAKRAPRFLGDIDHLDLMAACDAQKILARAIGRDLARHDLGDRHLEMLGQQRAIVLGQIGHRRKVAYAPVVDPLPDLTDPHLRLPLWRSCRNQRVAQLIARQTHEVLLATLGQLARDGQHILRDGGRNRIGGLRGQGRGVHGCGSGQVRRKEGSRRSKRRSYMKMPRLPNGQRGIPKSVSVGAYLQRFAASSIAAVNPRSEMVSLVWVPRPEAPLITAVVPRFSAAISAASWSAPAVQAYSPSVNSS